MELHEAYGMHMELHNGIASENPEVMEFMEKEGRRTEVST
jgi:hypothetical protein